MNLRYFALHPQKKPRSPKSGIKDGEGLIRSAKHLRYVRTLHCIDPLCERRDIEAAHVSHNVPKSERGGTGVKSSDVMVFPACKGHHHEAHQHGHETFERKYLPPGVTLAEYAIRVIASSRDCPDERIRVRAQELRGKV